MLTQEDVVRLSRPFPLEAHEWRKGRNDRDYVYITESGVVARLNEVDPSWTLVVTDRVERAYTTTRKTTKGEAYSLNAHELAVTVSLTVKGITRYGIGMAEVAADAAEADKSAVTDALKRAARLFGIGGYLLNDPPGKHQFGAWLARQAAALSEASAPAPSVSPMRRRVDLIRAAMNGDGVVHFQVWQNGQEIGEPEILLSRAQVEHLRDGGAVSADALNALVTRARTDGQSGSLELLRPADVTFVVADGRASAETVVLADARVR